MDSRHQLALSLNTIFATLALFLIIIPTFVMRGSFLKSVNAIPAFNSDLTATMGGGFVQLYTACVLGGLIIVQCIALISEDLRYPWWFGKELLLFIPRQPIQQAYSTAADSWLALCSVQRIQEESLSIDFQRNRLYRSYADKAARRS
jgi:hypothetical protein